MIGLTAADFEETQIATFKTAFVGTLSYLSSIAEVTEVSATDISSRRRQLLVSSVEIGFTMTVDLIASGLSTTDEAAIASAVAKDLTAAVSSGDLASAIGDAAAASDDTTLASASIDTSASEAVISSSTSATIVASTD